MKHLFKQMVFLTILLTFPLMGIHAQITIHMKNKPASEVVKQIEKVSKYRFFYKKGLPGMNTPITVEADDQGIETVMGQVVKQISVSYTIKGENQIVLSESGLSDTNADKKKSIKGTVTDTNGEPVIGANIIIKGSSKGTITDVDGKFALEVPENAVLLVSYIGYEPQELEIGNKTVLNIRLQEDMQNLDEVIVVGYGTQTRSSLTSSITEIKGDQLTNLPVANISRAIDSYVPGVTASATLSEKPGSAPTLSIRGENSMNNSAPLVLIDGIEGSMNSINSNDIANISVLKDAASTAIYGARAAGGVILITTKTGNKNQKIKINYSGSYSHREATRLPEKLDGYTYVQYRIISEEASGKSSALNHPDILVALQDPAITEIPDPSRPLTHFSGTANVDHVKEMMGSAGMHDHSLSMSGGNDKVSFLLSGAYLQEDALYRYGDFGFRRYNFRSNIDFKFTDKISLATRVSYSNSKTDSPVRGWDTEMHQAYYSHPCDPVRWSTTGQWGGNNDGNVIQDLVEGGHKIEVQDRLEVSANLKIDLAKGLTWNTIAGGYYLNTNTTEEYKSIFRYSVKPDVVIGKLYDPNSLLREETRAFYRNVQSYVNFDWNPIEKHTVKAMGGASYEDRSEDYYYGKRQSYLNNDLMGSLNLGLGDQYSGGKITEWGIASFFGRLNYNYNEKYYLEASFRVDGSSRFVKDKRWGFFPSVSASWRISEEDFMKDFTLLSDLKLRASWGNTGNQNSIGLYDYIAQMHVGTDYYPLGVSNTQEKFISQTALSSKERTWEKVEVKNIALDFGFLKNRLTGSLEYYIKDNKNMLVNVDVPAVIGMKVPTFNTGELRVWGWEGTLRWQDRIGKDFSYGVNFTIQDSHNKITKFDGSKNIISGTQNIEGYPIGSYFGYETEGLFQSDDEVKKHAFQHLNNAAGDVKYKDRDESGKIDAGDLTYLGNIRPRYVYNIGVNLKYKSFDVEMLFDGVGKKMVNLNTNLGAPVRFAMFKGHEDAWTPENPNAMWPRMYQNAGWNWWISDRTLHNAAYFSMKNLQVGYTLPQTWMEKIKVERLRLYANVRNPFIIDNYVEYLDPRLNAYNNYPVLRSYTIGLNLTF
ncbi:SusC/RagA family TonB-linked outer membrane protein [Parabacteroides goldsteinii]|uniref:SusC/RagA family TonB-linked outer membrane protein n=1 Tax=Parabacteroides goldsteinii TaxID=328812 RepID=UPI0013EC8204|nr:TonB-dependent receptor [Parabacteroides goldsteinii]